MSSPSPSSLEERVRDLERQVAALRARLLVLEQQMDPSVEHPTDRSVVREKSVYDWQGPR